MRLLLSALLSTGIALSAAAQTPSRDSVAGPVLSLDEAQTLARRANPQYQQIANNRRVAAAGVRSAYGQLLPSADASISGQFRQGGQTFFQGTSIGASSDIRQSSYDLSLSYTLNASRLLEPRLQNAYLDAVEADINGSAENLRNLIAQRYLTALQADAKAVLQDTLLVTTAAQLELAKVRAAVGAATQLDVRRAEVALGQQQVAVLQAHNTVEIEKLRLFQDMGVPQPANVRLTTTFAVSEPGFTLDSVLGLARGRNPSLTAFKAREKAARLGVRSAQSQYTPSLTLRTGWGGYTSSFTNDNLLVDQARAQLAGQQASCTSTQEVRIAANLLTNDDCSRYVLTDAGASAIRARNNAYPFDFTKNPWSISATLSLPIFDGLSREYRVQEAAAARDDARYNVRAQELRLTAEVTAAYLTLTTAARTVSLQTQNSAKAREELTLVEERYRVGAATFLDVTEARGAYERTENDRITAIYDDHKAYAALESAVGRPLR